MSIFPCQSFLSEMSELSKISNALKYNTLLTAIVGWNIKCEAWDKFLPPISNLPLQLLALNLKEQSLLV